MLMLRSTLNARIGRTGLPAPYVAQFWGVTAVAAVVAWTIKVAVPFRIPSLPPSSSSARMD
jgi:hypothetical protein